MNMAEPVKICIVVSGGLVQAVYGGAFVEAVLIDYDCINEGDKAGQTHVFPFNEMDAETRGHYDAVLADPEA